MFDPLMTILITPSTTPAQIFEARETWRANVVAGKMLPRGLTTNSELGIVDYKEHRAPVYEAMQECGMVLSLHGELPDQDPKSPIYCLDREREFLPVLAWIINKYPKLKIVLEHITTAEAVEFIRQCPKNIAATITLHHLLLTTNDIIGGKLRPHNFCMPTAKRFEDRAALRKAAFSGDPHFFFGSDSAPHLRSNKECDGGNAGIFTAPVVLSGLVTLFYQCDVLGQLNAFMSVFGAQHYGLPLNEGTITLVHRPWRVPPEYGGIVPFLAGEEMEWQVI